MNRSFNRNKLVSLVIGGITVLVLAVGLLVGTPTAHGNCSCWQQVSSPNASAEANYLTGVSRMSSTEVWASGYYLSSGIAKTMIEKWNGSNWSIVASPNVTTNTDNQLNAIVAYNDNTNGPAAGYGVIAVGSYRTSAASLKTLILGWNGNSWVVLSSPNVGSGDNQLNAITANNSNNIWAVGSYTSSGVQKTLVERSTDGGSTWSVVSSPNSAYGTGNLNGVSVAGTTDVWAVGAYTTSNPGDQPRQMTLHWLGTGWISEFSSQEGVLDATSFSGSNEGWSAGEINPFTYGGQGATRRWYNSAWQPFYNFDYGEMFGLRDFSLNDAWVVGIASYAGTTSFAESFHWNGSSWIHVPPVLPGISTFRSVSGSSLDVWAVGSYRVSGGVFRTLIERYNP